MALDAQAIRQDLQQEFPEIFNDPIHKPYVEDYVAIGAFLSGRKHIEPFLAAFENGLEMRLFNRMGIGDPANRSFHGLRRWFEIRRAKKEFQGWKSRLQASNQGQPVQKNKLFSKLVTDELADIETMQGFKLFFDDVGHPKAEMIMPLKAEQFRGQLRDARPFKDPTIGPDHGEYTHRLQWALISLAGIVQKPVKVYQHIGLVWWSKSSNFGLWDALVDRQPIGAPGLPQPFPFYKRNAHDFRTPEALLTWLCESNQQSRYPLLAGFLKARKDKRKYVTENDSNKDPLVFNYLSRKLFDKPFDSLNEEQQGFVQQTMESGQQKGVFIPSDNAPTYKQA